MVVPEQAERIGAEEVITQSFTMEHPNDELPEQFTDEQLQAAHITLAYTDIVDRDIGVKVVDDSTGHVSRDVLATYKTLLFRSTYENNLLEERLSNWRQIATACAIGFVLIVSGYWFS